MQLAIYIVRRLVYLLIALFLVSLITFVITRVLPGNPAYLIVGVQADESTVEAVTERLGLDDPIYQQYFTYLDQLRHFDLGDSWRTGNPVTTDIGARWPATIELGSVALLLAIAWSVPLGVLSALRRRSFSDRLANVMSGLGVSIPEFWLALILLLIFFGTWEIAPAPIGRTLGEIPEHTTGLYTIDAIISGNWAAFRSAAAQLVLPAVTLAFVTGAPLLRVTRGFMREVMASAHIRSAKALGIPKRSIVFRHALPNVLLPVSTMIAMMYGYLLGGTVLVEIVFAWPGIGKYAVDSINSSDFAPVLAAVLLSAVSYLFVYLVIDVLHFIIDPRTRT
jgi:peptide/nickel transport system permease protein